MTVVRTRTVQSGDGEAIRIPANVGFGPDAEVFVVRSGDVMTIYRAATTTAEMIELLRSLPAPPEVELRDHEDIPERPGL